MYVDIYMTSGDSGRHVPHSLFVKNKLKYSSQYFEVERSRNILQAQWPNILTFLIIFFKYSRKNAGLTNLKPFSYILKNDFIFICPVYVHVKVINAYGK